MEKVGCARDDGPRMVFLSIATVVMVGMAQQEAYMGAAKDFEQIMFETFSMPAMCVGAHCAHFTDA